MRPAAFGLFLAALPLVLILPPILPAAAESAAPRLPART